MTTIFTFKTTKKIKAKYADSKISENSLCEYRCNLSPNLFFSSNHYFFEMRTFQDLSFRKMFILKFRLEIFRMRISFHSGLAKKLEVSH
jgi:hypothetical protein